MGPVLTAADLRRRMWRALWTLPLLGAPAMAAALLLPPELDLAPLHWVPALLWPVLLVLSAVFVQSRLFFAALLTALVWLPHFPALAHAMPLDLSTLLVTVLPVGLAAISFLAGRGVLSRPALMPWGVILLLALAVGVFWLESGPFALAGLAMEVTAARELPGSIALTIREGLYLAGAVALLPAVIARNRLTDGLVLAFLLCGYCTFSRAVPLSADVCWSIAPLIATVAILIEAYTLAYKDLLTGLPGRRALEERGRQLGRKYAAAMVDIDHFKSFNDTHGHEAGDNVLRMVASRLTRVGGRGKSFRYGGEEFTILFQHDRRGEIWHALEQVRRRVANEPFTIRGPERPGLRLFGRRWRGSGRASPSVTVTISIGYALRGKQHDSLEEVLKSADQQLYEAKKKGRNRVEPAATG